MGRGQESRFSHDLSMYDTAAGQAVIGYSTYNLHARMC